jgi:RNA polymerase sigma-70 factor (ECF subfamily)
VSEIKPVTEPVGIARRDLGTASLTAIIAAAYDTHASSIYGLALRTTSDPELAADVTQEAFLRLLQEGQRGRLPDNAGAWLYRTSTNLIITRARRTAVARRFAPRLVARDEPDGPDVVTLGNEQHRELDASLASLSVADRVVLVMAAQGASGEEIAKHLGHSHGAVRTQLTRARRRLRAAVLDREAMR